MQPSFFPKFASPLIRYLPRRWTIPRFIMQPQGQTTTTTKTPRTTGKKKIKPNEHDTFLYHTGVTHSIPLHSARYHPMYVYLRHLKITTAKRQENPIPPLPQIIHRKDEPKTHHFQNSTKVSPKTNPFQNILPFNTMRKSRVRQSLFSSLQSNPSISTPENFST